MIRKPPFIFFVFQLFAALLLGQETADYRVFWTKSSLLGKHFKSQGYYQNLPVFNLIKNCHILSHETSCMQEEFRRTSPKQLDSKTTILQEEKGFWFQANQFHPAVQIHYTNEQGLAFLGVQVNEELVYSYPLQSNFNDTIIAVKVYRPNPIVSSGANYGGPFADHGDLNNLSLDLQLSIHYCEARYDNGQFLLENKWAKLVDVSPPFDMPFTLANPQFFFNRSATEFESVNAFYHVTQICKKVEFQYNYSNFFSEQIHIDAHALDGLDNSRFRTVGTQPQLLFGQGGVDDAEDGQVVVHEMGHALSYFASPGTNMGDERQAIDEGLSDYFAVAYTEEIVGYSINEVPTWDGHNEFWNGRITNSNKVYPKDFVQDIYSDAEIWSSAIKEVHEVIGRIATEKSLLESMFYYKNYMTMPEAAQYFLTADSLLNSGNHTDTIKSIFCKRGLYGNCDLPPDYTQPVTVNFEFLQQGILRFTSNVDEFNALDVYSMSGQKVAAFSGKIPTTLVLKDLTPGVYVLHLYNGNQFQNLKIILF